MKKWLLVFVCFALICCTALAEELDTPALKNPEERYEIFFDETDSSENAVYLLLDATNDEAATVEEYGALRMDNIYYSEGEEVLRSQMLLQTCDYGRLIATFFEDEPERGVLYTTANFGYMAKDGKLTYIDAYEDPNFDWYWDSFHFPYGSLEIMNGVRQDEEGNSYFFITSDDTMCFEFAATSGMFIEELRIYAKDENGELALISVVKYSSCEAKEVPQEVLAAMAEHETAQESTNMASALDWFTNLFTN